MQVVFMTLLTYFIGMVAGGIVVYAYMLNDRIVRVIIQKEE